MQMDMQAKKITLLLFVPTRQLWMQQKVKRGREQKRP
jgi:hypothetical protein